METVFFVCLFVFLAKCEFQILNQPRHRISFHPSRLFQSFQELCFRSIKLVQKMTARRRVPGVGGDLPTLHPDSEAAQRLQAAELDLDPEILRSGRNLKNSNHWIMMRTEKDHFSQIT